MTLRGVATVHFLHKDFKRTFSTDYSRSSFYTPSCIFFSLPHIGVSLYHHSVQPWCSDIIRQPKGTKQHVHHSPGTCKHRPTRRLLLNANTTLPLSESATGPNSACLKCNFIFTTYFLQSAFCYTVSAVRVWPIAAIRAVQDVPSQRVTHSERTKSYRKWERGSATCPEADLLGKLYWCSRMDNYSAREFEERPGTALSPAFSHRLISHALPSSLQPIMTEDWKGPVSWNVGGSIFACIVSDIKCLQ